MSLCEDCFKGVLHEGTPTGKFQKIGGVNCYVATPTGDYAKDTVVLLLADIFGIQSNNAQLLMDAFANNGYKVVGPDYLDGDSIPAEDMTVPAKMSDWLSRHPAAKTRPPLDKLIATLKAGGVSKFGATGYCFGGRYVFDLAFDNAIQAAIVAHPSLLKIPEDLQKYALSSVPLLINSCETDPVFPLSAQSKADDILGNFKPGYRREYFEGCTHGFAVRGDMNNSKVKAGKEGAFSASVEFLSKYLRKG